MLIAQTLILQFIKPNPGGFPFLAVSLFLISVWVENVLSMAVTSFKWLCSKCSFLRWLLRMHSCVLWTRPWLHEAYLSIGPSSLRPLKWQHVWTWHCERTLVSEFGKVLRWPHWANWPAVCLMYCYPIFGVLSPDGHSYHQWLGGAGISSPFAYQVGFW